MLWFLKRTPDGDLYGRMMKKYYRNIFIYVIFIFIYSCSPKISSFNYPYEISKYKIKKIRSLGRALNESSALEYFNDKFWSVNDSGNKNFLYSFEAKEKTKINEILIYPSSNVDWESLDQDENYLYISDVGDNYGRREILKIYLIPKDSLLIGIGKVSDSILISFNEKKPDPRSLKFSSHDCEAITVINDSIYLFTKNWISLTSDIYVIPAKPGFYNAARRMVLKTNLLITGVDYCNESGNLWLSGYKKFRPSFLLYPDFDPYSAHQHPFLSYDFRRYFGLQVEGITLTPDGKIYFSCEKTFYPASLFELKRRD